MKRLLLLLLMLLTLWGCGSPEEPTVPATEAPPAVTELPTEPSGLYNPDHTLEMQTAGALKVYPLAQTRIQGLRPMGSDLLVFSAENEATTLIKLCGNQLYEAARATLACVVYPEDPAVQVSETGITYYDSIQNDLVFLDSQLRQVSRVQLPEETVGQPALSADRKSIYYLTEESLREMDLELGIDRMIRQMSFPHQSITGLHWDDAVIECSIRDEQDNWIQIFLQVSTGEQIHQTSEYLNLTTGSGRYFLRRMDGLYPEMLTGTDVSEIFMLHTPDYRADSWPIPAQAAAVTATQTDDCLLLDYYRLDDGIRPYSLSLPSSAKPIAIVPHPSGDALWLLCNWETDGNLVCRWDLSKSALADDTVYIGTRRTPENPDIPGLENCAELAARISEKHGVEILTWTGATAVQPPDYSFVPEYQPALLNRYLNMLDQALSRYPAGMLAQTASETGDGKLRIGLVRSITAISGNAMPEASSGFQFRDEATGNIHVILPITEDFENHLNHVLFHVIESRIFSLSQALDNWEDLNPPGFSYDYSYLHYADRQDSQLIEGQTRAFIDFYSITFPVEDRARIMEYAMMEDMEDCFSSDFMQAKLKALCTGIRKAYRLTDTAAELPWEQYLKEPIRKLK